jgi:hypothetical protein
MKRAVLAFAALILAAPALAQQPQVTIEDDVSHENAIKCAALRFAQVNAGTADAVTKAAHEAWLKSLEGQHGVKVRDQIAARARSITPQQMAAMANDCAPFEIRSSRPPVG